MLLPASELPPRYAQLYKTFAGCYLNAVGPAPVDLARAEKLVTLLLKHAVDQAKNPFIFPYVHTATRTPFDFYAFGLDFIRPLIDLPRSCVLGANWLKTLDQQRREGANIIFLANHQIEADPQVLSILLQPHFPQLAEEIFCVAGARVTSDPLAVPFTRGCNILSVYSKKHMDEDPEKRAEQQTHNLRTLKGLGDMLSQGGCAIWMAPSGGRDRPDAEGNLLPASFDPQSVQLFRLLAKKADKPVYFYPLALATYAILPPPDTRQAELGEERIVAKSPVGLACGAPLDFSSLSASYPDRKLEQQAASLMAHSAVIELYQRLQIELKALLPIKNSLPLFKNL